MFDSIYTGMSGLISYSKGLSGIGNNVANMNTPGFKGSDLEFLDLFYRYQYSGSPDQGASPYTQGGGVQTGASVTRFTQGDFRQTGNTLDAAVDGNGFFVLRTDGRTLYTRAGQFEFNPQGILVSREDGAEVAGYEGGSLTRISLAGRRSVPATATTRIEFSDSLSVGSPTHEITNITLYDSLGVQHALTLSMTNNSTTTPGSWTFTLKEGTQTVTSGEVRYSGSGTPVPGFERATFVYTPTNGARSEVVSLDFSASNAFSSASSTLRVSAQNGKAAGFLSTTALDVDGSLVLSYSNGETVRSHKLALAHFVDTSVLQPEGGNRFALFGDARPVYGSPGQSVFGALRVGSVELSNVDLAREFSELIVVQRGYQASSQVISAANEMIQQLGEIRGRR